MQHPCVLECAITGVPDPVRGQVIKATVVLAKNYLPPEGTPPAEIAEYHKRLAKEIPEKVQEVTAPYKYPRVVELDPELPKTISGKIRRVEIRE